MPELALKAVLACAAVIVNVWLPSFRVTLTSPVASSLNSRAASTLLQVLTTVRPFTTSPTFTVCLTPLRVALYSASATGAAPPPGTTRVDTCVALVPAADGVVTAPLTAEADADTMLETSTPETVKAWLLFFPVSVSVRVVASKVAIATAPPLIWLISAPTSVQLGVASVSTE